MSVLRKACGALKWFLALPFALLVMGPGLMIAFSNILRLAIPDFPDHKNIIVITVLQLAICLAVAFLIRRNVIRGPLFVAMSIAMITGSTICASFACVLTYTEYKRTAPYRKLIGPLGGPDLLIPKPDTDVNEVKIGRLYGRAVDEDNPQPLVVCTNKAAIRDLLVVLQQAKKVEEHKCSSEGVIYLRAGTNTLDKLEFLAGHAHRYYEFRHGSGIYRIPKSAFFSAITGLGYETQRLEKATR